MIETIVPSEMALRWFSRSDLITPARALPGGRRNIENNKRAHASGLNRDLEYITASLAPYQRNFCLIAL